MSQLQSHRDHVIGKLHGIQGALLLGCMAGFTALPAQADTVLATGGLYGGHAQRNALCYVFNAGSTALTLAGGQIIDQAGNFLVRYRFTLPCTGVLGSLQTCAISATISDGQTHSCVFWVAGSKTDGRGALSIRDSSQNVLVTSELR